MGSNKGYSDIELASENLALQLKNQPLKPKELFSKHAEFAAKSVISYKTQYLKLLCYRFGRLPSLDPYARQISRYLNIFSLNNSEALILFLLITFLTFKILIWLVNSLLIRSPFFKLKTN